MADDSDLIRRANSLLNAEAAGVAGDRREGPRRIGRRRSFIASTTPPETAAGAALPAPAASEDDDLPLLTEVVLPLETIPEDSAESIDARLRPGLAADLADRIARHLGNELPALLECALRQATEQVGQGIAATVETAMRDFLAQRGQLRLPLPDADSEQAGGAEQA